MKIEVGKTYLAKNIEGSHAVVCEKELSDNGDVIVSFIDEDGDLNKLSKVHFEMTYKEINKNKPAHYDTEIDTLAFAKANFSREQVEGFMRINAVKYLQRNKGEKLSDLKKCAAYVQMLIEMEEEDK